MPQYLGTLAANATTIINAEDYGRTVYDLATRRALIIIGEDMVNGAYDSPVDFTPQTQIEEAETRLYDLAEQRKYGQGFLGFGTALTNAIDMANAAYQRSGHLSGLVDRPDRSRQQARRPAVVRPHHPRRAPLDGQDGARDQHRLQHRQAAYRAERQPDGIDKTVDGAIVGFFSLEMSAEQLATRILSEQTEIASEKIRRGMINEDEFRKLVAREPQTMSQIPLYIDQTGGISIAQLAARARKLKRQKGLGLLDRRLPAAADRLVKRRAMAACRRSPRSPRASRRWPRSSTCRSSRCRSSRVRWSNATTSARSFPTCANRARSSRTPTSSCSCSARNITSSAASPTRRTPSSANGSTKMSRVHGKAEVIIGKQRHGPAGTVQLAFEGQFTRFSNLERHYQTPDYIR